jgi:hypothetical protein
MPAKTATAAGPPFLRAFVDDALRHLWPDAGQLFEFPERCGIDVDRFGRLLGRCRRRLANGLHEWSDAFEPGGTDARHGSQVVRRAESAPLVTHGRDPIGEVWTDLRQLEQLSAVGAIEVESGRLEIERPGRRADEADGQQRTADAEQKGSGQLRRPRPRRCGRQNWRIGGHVLPPSHPANPAIVTMPESKIQNRILTKTTGGRSDRAIRSAPRDRMEAEPNRSAH